VLEYLHQKVLAVLLQQGQRHQELRVTLELLVTLVMLVLLHQHWLVLFIRLGIHHTMLLRSNIIIQISGLTAIITSIHITLAL
jgi:hypothetical protein